MVVKTLLVACFLIYQPLLSTSVSAEDTVNPHYAQLLNYSMLFYEAQRSGKLPENNRIPWRKDSALTDGFDNNVSLTEGYFDAGNYLKFTVPLSHAISLLSWGAAEWFDSYQRTNLVEDLRGTIKWGTDWLIKAHPEPNVLFVQVGGGEIDNEYWGPDTGIPLPRPSYKIDSSAPGTDAAALTSAALSSASYLFKNYLNDTTYADELLAHAVSLMDFAETAKPWKPYSQSVPAAVDYYNTNKYQSQLLFGSLWLNKATGNNTYLEKANAYHDMFRNELFYGITDWSDQTGAALVLGASLNATKYKQTAIDYLDRVLDTTSQDSICNYTYGGLFYCQGYSYSNSVMPPLNTALLIGFMKKSFPETGSNYTDFIKNQMNYILGNNHMNTPYIVGVHKNSPRNPHHAAASGGTDLKKINESPKEMAHTLYGAIVGGPDYYDNFYDIRNDYRQTEVALDYNAPYQSLLAYQISIGALDPPYVNITQDRPNIISGDDSFAGWKIAVIVVSILLFLALVALAFWWRKRKQRAKNANKDVFVDNLKEGDEAFVTSPTVKV
ncbi:glycoside hydrolase family 9 protein [Mucor ambiguus]|uniref:Endoglucanase n=1 Tax=Mucor ambiguus TaxID=91626 RepID=A0A0C9M625_9FUNG|nr:glycoside hydrolase family 9 protein [Mucor ambiguus]